MWPVRLCYPSISNRDCDWCLIGQLNSKRFECCQGVHRGIMSPLGWSWQSLTAGCYRGAKVIGGYLNILKAAKIMPHDIEFTEHRFCDIMASVSSLIPTYISQYPCRSSNCCCNADSNNILSTDLGLEITAIKAQEKTFTCLDCLKTDGRSRSDAKCRISHS